MKYPIAYIQGPPGTGKTNTIINTIVTAFFNERTVLFASYNNHPINGVCEKLSRMRYRDQVIPFPMLRLGNQDKVREALKTMERLYQSVRDVKVYESTLDRNRDDRKHRARKLSELLRRYEERLELRERRETLETLAKYEEANSRSLEMLAFQTDLTGRQKRQIDRRLERLGEVSEEEALSLLDDDLEELKKYLLLYFRPLYQETGQPQNQDLLEIIQMEDEISSLCAVCAASVAGDKAMTATSGPGFSLMQEALGYAIMGEIPCVVTSVQRGGPSTGLPTKVAQGDVNQARWGCTATMRSSC